MANIKAFSVLKAYYANQTLETDNINSILFLNQGDVTAVINGALRIRPGLSLANNQSHFDVVDITTYSLVFDPADAFSTGSDQNLLVLTTKIKR